MIRLPNTASECEAGAEHHEPGWASPKGQGQDGPGNNAKQELSVACPKGHARRAGAMEGPGNGSGQYTGGSALEPALPAMALKARI